MNLRNILNTMKRKYNCIHINHVNKSGSVCNVHGTKFTRLKYVENGFAGYPTWTHIYDYNYMKKYCNKCSEFEPNFRDK